MTLADELAGRFTITAHALMEMGRRGLSAAVIEGILKAPGQVFEAWKGRKVFQSMVSFPPESKEYLVRVFVDVDRNPAEVVTAYRCSRVGKYWRET